MLKIVELATKWIGVRETDSAFKSIIDTYNSYSPLPQGYKMKYTDAWCATFISYLAIECGLTDIIPVECGCERQINLFKALGEWNENDAYVPNEGDIIYYDWQDSGVGDNTGWSDHVGIVEKCENGIITVIEGNKSDAVSRRCIGVNAQYIRGYGVPAYSGNNAEPVVEKPTVETPKEEKKVQVTLTQLSKGSKGQEVKSLQTLLNAKGAFLDVDGSFGKLTDGAVRAYQRSKGLDVDGIVGKQTWTSLLTS